jgi:hypothetical protein
MARCQTVILKESVMFTEKTVAVLAALEYRPDADWDVNILPFGSVFWNDEMPAIASLFERQDDISILFTMFGMRLKLWDGETLNAADRELWDAVQRQVPHWALFKRLSLSDEQRVAREQAERQVEQSFESLGAEQDGHEDDSR